MFRKLLAVACGFVLASLAVTAEAASNPTSVRTDIYRATFDVLIDWTTGNEIAASPFMDIQNPKLNTFNMGVTVKIPYNPKASSTSPSAGVTQHEDPVACTLNLIRIDPGEGLTLDALEIIARSCQSGPSCQTTPCTRSGGCTGTGCYCILFPGQSTGRCVYLGTTYNVVPDRITFEVEIQMDTTDILPSVRGTDFITMQGASVGTIIAAKDAEIDRDTAQ